MKYYSFHNINILNVILVTSWLFPAAKKQNQTEFLHYIDVRISRRYGSKCALLGRSLDKRFEYAYIVSHIYLRPVCDNKD